MPPVADQYIRYPNDLSLINEARLKTEKLIDQLYELLKLDYTLKPRTYRRLAHERYLKEELAMLSKPCHT